MLVFMATELEIKLLFVDGRGCDGCAGVEEDGVAALMVAGTLGGAVFGTETMCLVDIDVTFETSSR